MMTFENEISTRNYTNIPKRLEFQGDILILVSPILKYSDCTVPLPNSVTTKKDEILNSVRCPTWQTLSLIFGRPRVVTINMDHIDQQVPNVSFETQHSFSFGTDLSDTLQEGRTKNSCL